MTEPAERLGELLRTAGLTVAVAESCTGGLLGGQITAVPGSSDYFLGGVIVYSNAAKETLLRISPRLLEEKGAVSQEVAIAMAESVRRLLGTDIGIGITGIAGPAGATPGKPVGLVYVALSAADGQWCHRHLFPEDRAGNRARSAEAALRMACRVIEEGTA
jgi:PncC family amidohydrolase